MPLRLALFGTGRAARARLRALAERSDVTVAVIASADPARAHDLALPLGADSTTDWQAAVTRPDIDAVLISTRNEHHAAMVEAALRAGKHVTVDYPLALSLVEGERLIALAHATGLILHCEHIELLSPWFRTVEQHLPAIGEPLAVTWTDLSARQPTPIDWTFDTRSGFSLFAGASVLSRLVRLAGPIAHATATERLDGLTPESRFTRRLTTAQLRFGNGTTGHILDGTGLATPGPSSSLALIGTEGTLSAQNRAQVTLTRANETTLLPLPSTPGLFAQDLDAFFRLIRGDGPAYVTLDHVLTWMRAADLAERSAWTTSH